jgi:hypothetical protein
MPALVAGIHAAAWNERQGVWQNASMRIGVDGRDEPGHDDLDERVSVVTPS